MIMMCWDTFKDTFAKLHCKHCGFQSLTATRLIWHLWKKHKIKLSMRDWKFLAIYNLGTRLILFVLALLLFIPCVVLKVILLPLKYLYEIL